MSAPVTLFEHGGSLAQATITVTDNGYAINCRSPQVAHRRKFSTAGDAAEIAKLYRDDGGWHLRFDDGTDEVRRLVGELDEMEGKR